MLWRAFGAVYGLDAVVVLAQTKQEVSVQLDCEFVPHKHGAELAHASCRSVAVHMSKIVM